SQQFHRLQANGRVVAVTPSRLRIAAIAGIGLFITVSELDPKFSPDGRWLVYDSDDSGRGEGRVHVSGRRAARKPPLTMPPEAREVATRRSARQSASTGFSRASARAGWARCTSRKISNCGARPP